MWTLTMCIPSQTFWLIVMQFYCQGQEKKKEKKRKSECIGSVWHAWALTSCYGVHLKPRTIIMPQELLTQYHIFTSTAACHTRTALCCDYSPLLAHRTTHCCMFTLCHYAVLCIYNWAHVHPSGVQAMSLAKPIFCYHLHWKLRQIWGQVSWGE